MFVPAPIDGTFVPYTKRRAAKHKAALFIEGASGRRRSGPRIIPQQTMECLNNPVNAPCGCNPVTRKCLGHCMGHLCVPD
jgi:hypothetical protein